MRTIKKFFINITIPKLIVLILLSFAIKFTVDFGLRDFLVPFFMIFSFHTEEPFRLLAANEIVNKIVAIIEVATLIMIVYIFKLAFANKVKVQNVTENIARSDSTNNTLKNE